ncbi:MAG: hypothetical protein OXD32_01110, partial [Endozoicomonadaceae bacterium]|nr:hypothetical protein [Endozoicomonadaceae bacterium]
MNKTVSDSEKTNKLIIRFLLLFKQLFYYRSCRLFTAILSVIFSFTLTLAGNALSSEKAEVTRSSDQQPANLYDVFTQHQKAPVELMNSFYYLADSEIARLSAKKIPVVTITAYISKDQRQSELKANTATLLSVLKTFNNGFPVDNLIHSIDQKKALPLTKSLLFEYLLKQYSSIYYKDEEGAVKTLTVTLGGMLFHLEQSAQQQDPVASIILAFLKQPFYETSFSSEVRDPQSSFFFLKYLKPLFSVSERKPTFSERFKKLSDLSDINDDTRSKIIFYLKKQGYEYKKDHLFATYELDEAGKAFPVVSDDLVPTYAETQDMIPIRQSTSPSGKSGVSSASKQLATALLITGVFCTAMMNTQAKAPSGCGSDDNCRIQKNIPLFARDYAQTLAENPACSFMMAEDIYLEDTDSLPLFPNCSAPFSGSISTGSFTLHANDSTAPLLGCMCNANFEGNINLCQ